MIFRGKEEIRCNNPKFENYTCISDEDLIRLQEFCFDQGVQ